MQYFERVRLEYHPENAPPYDVLLGQFGRRIARTGDRGAVSPLDTPPTAPVPGRVYFPETGHNVAPRFFAYWEANGGLTQFGYPLTEESPKRLEDGQTYTVQYFERARFERHSENDPPYDVLLGQFGRQILAENDALADDRPFQLLYLTDARAQGLLGFVTGTVSVAPGAYLPFERGLMLYEGGAARRIYVFCRSEQFGVTLGPTLADRFFPDPARPGDPPGGGSGPQPGLYEPGSGFGALWRERESIRSCLGYATRPDEIGYTIRRLEFSRGTMLSAVTPAGAFIYVQYASSGPYLYERFPDVGR